MVGKIFRAIRYVLLRKFLSKNEEKQIIDKIKKIESTTNTEIRVHLATKKVKNVGIDAHETFERIGMMKTKERNGIMMYINLRNKEFVVIGDEGIHQRLPKHFWQDMVDAVQIEFKKGKFTEGIINAIEKLRTPLEKFFPKTPTDTNELPNEISKE
ncbi:TPM domain-containing protein [Candidatus Margulisiibacteriota bacterium]